MLEITFPIGCLLSVEERYNIIKDFFNKHARVIVEFRKKNGDLRLMPCTLSADLIPEAQLPKTRALDDIPLVDLNTVSVYCTDKNAWRSFKTENVLNIRAEATDIDNLVEVTEENGEYLLNFTEEQLKKLNWTAGDQLEWTFDQQTQQVTLKKKA